MKVLLAVALLAVGGLFLLSRDEADAPLPGPGDAPAERRDRDRTPPRERGRALEPVRCPSGVAGCREVTGRVVLVESVDADGDGDLHVVLAAGGISLPGVTAVDVRPGLRPKRDPAIGDRASAAGPVQTGSYGQSQIHALRFRVQR